MHTRWAQVLIRGLWKRMEFSELQRGDLFRIYNQDGTPVDGGEVHVADGEPYETMDVDETGTTWGIKTHLAGREVVKYVDVDCCSTCELANTDQDYGQTCNSSAGREIKHEVAIAGTTDWCPLLEGPVLIQHKGGD